MGLVGLANQKEGESVGGGRGIEGQRAMARACDEAEFMIVFRGHGQVPWGSGLVVAFRSCLSV